jgi:hypothetical protein
MVNDILVSDGADDEENVIIIRRQITMSCIHANEAAIIIRA